MSSRFKWPGALLSTSLLATVSTPAFAAGHAPPVQPPKEPVPPLLNRPVVSPEDGSVNVKPNTPVVFSLASLPGMPLPEPQHLPHPGPKPQAPWMIAVSTGTETTLYAATDPSIQWDPDTQTITWTPPAPLTRYTTYSVALVYGHTNAALQQQLHRSGMTTLTLDNMTLAQILWDTPAPVPPIPPHGSNMIRGEIATVSAHAITLFGGETVPLTQATTIDLPGTPHTTWDALRPGMFIQVQGSQIHVLPAPQVSDTVFTTGSALGEPVHWTAQESTGHPSVLTGDRVTVSATDSYGDPATTGSFAIQGAAVPDLSSTFQAPSGTIADGQGSTIVTDHQAQTVDLTIHTTGPYAGHDDQTLSLKPVTYQPGPPAKMTLSGPTTMEAGASHQEIGDVTDIYGNPVTATAIDLSASAGQMPSTVSTVQGTLTVPYTAPTALHEDQPGTGETVTIQGQSVQGTATASTTVTIDPGPLAHLMLNSIKPVNAGQTVQLTGTATDSYGNAVLNGTVLTVTTVNDTVSHVTTTGGGFTVAFTAPTTPGTYPVTVSGNGQTQSTTVTVVTPIPQDAVVAFGSPQTQSNGQTLVQGTVTANGQAVSGAVLTLQATGATVTNSSVMTNAQGQFSATLNPSGSTMPVTVTVQGVTTTGGTVQGTVGIDPIIYGNQAWTNTGIAVQAGQKITVSSTGSWADDLSAMVIPDGATASSGIPVQVGSQGTFISGIPGTLYLGPGALDVSGNVDALVTLTGGGAGLQPTIDLDNGTHLTAAPHSTLTIEGQVNVPTGMGSYLPAVGTPVQLTTTAGSFNDPTSQVVVTTGSDGYFTATFNVPASGSATVTATIMGSEGQPITQSIEITVASPTILSGTMLSPAGIGTGTNQWLPEWDVDSSSATDLLSQSHTSGAYTGIFLASGLSGSNDRVALQYFAPAGTTMTSLTWSGYGYNGAPSVLQPAIWALVENQGIITPQVVWAPTDFTTGVDTASTSTTLTLPANTVGVQLGGVVNGSWTWPAINWSILWISPQVGLSNGTTAALGSIQ